MENPRQIFIPLDESSSSEDDSEEDSIETVPAPSSKVAPDPANSKEDSLNDVNYDALAMDTTQCEEQPNCLSVEEAANDKNSTEALSKNHMPALIVEEHLGKEKTTSMPVAQAHGPGESCYNPKPNIKVMLNNVGLQIKDLPDSKTIYTCIIDQSHRIGSVYQDESTVRTGVQDIYCSQLQNIVPEEYVEKMDESESGRRYDSALLTAFAVYLKKSICLISLNHDANFYLKQRIFLPNASLKRLYLGWFNRRYFSIHFLHGVEEPLFHAVESSESLKFSIPCDKGSRVEPFPRMTRNDDEEDKEYESALSESATVPKSQFRCTFCTAVFKLEGHLSRHVKICYRQFLCQHCGISVSADQFYDVSKFKKFKLNHLSNCKKPKGNKELPTCEKCGIAFKYRSRAKKHQLSCMKIWQCDKCNKRFKAKCNFTRHKCSP